MNRNELHWMLNSVMPHVGTTEITSNVGLEVGNGSAVAYATDRYTFALADVDDDGPAVLVNLPVKEAKDLLRFVRPTLVATHLEPVQLLVNGAELHVGIPDDSAVFDILPEVMLTARTFHDFYARLSATPREWEQQVYQPSLFARFAKAQRDETDRLRIFPHRFQELYGAALVTVGEHFMGAIAGLTYDEVGDPTMTSEVAA